MKVNVADGHAKLFVGGYYLRIKSKNELEEWITHRFGNMKFLIANMQFWNMHSRKSPSPYLFDFLFQELIH